MTYTSHCAGVTTFSIKIHPVVREMDELLLTQHRQSSWVQTLFHGGRTRFARRSDHLVLLAPEAERNELRWNVDVVPGQPDQAFYLQLSSPVNCTLGTSQATATIVNSDLLYLLTDTTGYTTPGSCPGYHLAWSDEFNSNTLNPQNWTFDIGNNNGWGNQELEYYTSSTNNAFVSAGEPDHRGAAGDE